MTVNPDPFRNDLISTDQIPDVTTIPLTPLPGAFVRYQILQSLIGWGVIAVGGGVAVWFFPPLDGHGLWVFGGILILVVPNLILTVLEARQRGWALRTHDLVMHTGLLWRRRVAIPIARIQHVETTSGPMERGFGLERLKCFTAGGTGADLVLEGLSAADAQRVREFLLDRIGLEADEVSGADGSV